VLLVTDLVIVVEILRLRSLRLLAQNDGGVCGAKRLVRNDDVATSPRRLRRMTGVVPPVSTSSAAGTAPDWKRYLRTWTNWALMAEISSRAETPIKSSSRPFSSFQPSASLAPSVMVVEPLSKSRNLMSITA